MLDSDESARENGESACDLFDDFGIQSSAATPLTPLSSKTSPRHPSDLLKSNQCTYPDCPKSFNRPAKLMQHLRSHTNTRLFVCPHAPCNKDFLRESHLKHHIKSAHFDDRDHICTWEGCGKGFVSATRLRRHQASHEGKEKFRCTFTGCGQQFRKHGTLQKHILTIHEGKDPFVCTALDETGQECRAGFDTEGRLNSHVGRVHGSRRFVCNICSQGDKESTIDVCVIDKSGETVFPTYASLQAHLASEHPPTCPECGLQCTTQNALKSHLEVIHGGFDIDERRIHICQESNCGRGFTKKGNLNTHIQISHAMKRFICGEVDQMKLNNIGGWDGSDACHEAFKSKANLEKHIRAKHLGLRTASKAHKQNRIKSYEKSNQGYQTSALTRLTGVGYGSENGRNIACLVQGCDYRFAREYDHEIHLQSRHGLADLEIQNLLLENENSSQPPWQETSSLVIEQSWTNSHRIHADPDDGMDVDHGNEAYEMGVMNNAGPWTNGSFWQRGSGGDTYSDEQLQAQFLASNDLADSRCGKSSTESVPMIDPSLLYQR